MRIKKNKSQSLDLKTHTAIDVGVWYAGQKQGAKEIDTKSMLGRQYRIIGRIGAPTTSEREHEVSGIYLASWAACDVLGLPSGEEHWSDLRFVSAGFSAAAGASAVGAAGSAFASGAAGSVFVSGFEASAGVSAAGASGLASGAGAGAASGFSGFGCEDSAAGASAGLSVAGLSVAGASIEWLVFWLPPMSG